MSASGRCDEEMSAPPRASLDMESPVGIEACSAAEPLKGESGEGEKAAAKPRSSACVRKMCCSCQCTAETCSGAWRGKGAWKLWAGVSCCTAISIGIIVAGAMFGPLVFFFDDSPYECPVIVPNDTATSNGAASSAAYSLVEEHSGPGFLDGWDFFDGDDPTHGFVNYLPKEAATDQSLAYYNDTTGLFYLRSDTSSVVSDTSRGRDSTRLHSKRNYTYGLFTMAATHIPTGCGTWAAWWMYNEPWPDYGEIDIVEYISKEGRNSLVGHTRGGCDVPAPEGGASFQGKWKPDPYSPSQPATECDIEQGPQGCAAWWPPGTAGRPFNEAGGGTYAMEWDPNGARVFFWSDGCGGPPQDLVDGDPKPSTWGVPMARFDFTPDQCPTERYREMFMVINLTFCGSWAGGINWAQCWIPHGFNCDIFVRDHPEAFEDAYWAIRHVRVYQQQPQPVGQNQGEDEGGPKLF